MAVFMGNQKPTVLILLVLFTLSLTGCGGGSLASTSNFPPPPPPGTAASVSKDGITWTFRQSIPVGQFVNGSVLNLPTADSKSGFDSRLNDGTNESWWFDASLRSYPPSL